MSTLPTGQTGNKDPTPSGAQRDDRRFPGTKRGTCVLGFKVLRGEVKKGGTSAEVEGAEEDQGQCPSKLGQIQTKKEKTESSAENMPICPSCG